MNHHGADQHPTVGKFEVLEFMNRSTKIQDRNRYLQDFYKMSEENETRILQAICITIS